MKRIKPFVIAGAALLLIIVAANTFFVVEEYESAVVMRFNMIIATHVRSGGGELKNELAADQKFSYVNVYEGAGLKVKIPFVDSVVKYDNRLQTYDTPARQVITVDKNKLMFDNNAQWKVTNPVLFNVTMGSFAYARERIEDIMYSHMNEKVGKLSYHTLITDKDMTENMLLELARDVTDVTRQYGVEVYDIRIRRTDLPAENYASVYNRMITERGRIAAQYRSEGDEEAIKIKADTDRQATVVVSEAYRTAEVLKGEGDAEAARIYNEAYSKDFNFYEFYNMLETYRKTLGEKTTLVIPLDSPFAKYLLDGRMSSGAAQP